MTNKKPITFYVDESLKEWLHSKDASTTEILTSFIIDAIENEKKSGVELFKYLKKVV